MKKIIKLNENDLHKIIKNVINIVLNENSNYELLKGNLGESVSLYGKTVLTYEDIPQIMNGKLPYREGYNNQKWYVLPLPNGKYCTYLCSEENKEEKIKKNIKKLSKLRSKNQKRNGILD